MTKDILKKVPLGQITITDTFWNHYIGLVSTVILPHMWELINDRVPGAEKSYSIQNFRIAAGELEGEHHGAVFQDTDLAKWLEAVAFSLSVHPDPELEQKADEAIALIGRAQCEDGYLNTYYTITGKERWSDLLEGHELYTAGHMMEAAVAYTEATGKTAFLEIVRKNADCIDRAFGPGEGQIHGYPGHPEIELALVKLYRATGEERYLRLAEYFVRERGRQPSIFDQQDARKYGKYMFPEFHDFDLDYAQAHKPLQTQTEAEGHAVRAGYLYSAMADLAGALKDETLLTQCRILWEDIVYRKLYITGSIGSAAFGERFTGSYDLPNDTNYSESCASIALAMFSDRLFTITREGRYMDEVERALYNTVLAGIALDGKHFFYVNPLAVEPDLAERNPTMRHVKTVRQSWFGCACCPPNIARTLASIGYYLYDVGPETIYLNLFIQNEAELQVAGQPVHVSVRANYPAEGEVKVTVSGLQEEGAAFGLALRKPGYVEKRSLALQGVPVPEGELQSEGGYDVLRRIWRNGDELTLRMDIEFAFLYADPRISADAGKVALVRGPWVYCLEEADNGTRLASIRVTPGTRIAETTVPRLPEGVPAAAFSGRRSVIPEGDTAPLYRTAPPREVETELVAIPYCLWNNRGRGEMLVWMRT